MSSFLDRARHRDFKATHLFLLLSLVGLAACSGEPLSVTSDTDLPRDLGATDHPLIEAPSVPDSTTDLEAPFADSAVEGIAPVELVLNVLPLDQIESFTLSYAVVGAMACPPPANQGRVTAEVTLGEGALKATVDRWCGAGLERAETPLTADAVLVLKERLLGLVTAVFPKLPSCAVITAVERRVVLHSSGGVDVSIEGPEADCSSGTLLTIESFDALRVDLFEALPVMLGPFI